MIIRTFSERDLPALLMVFFESVHVLAVLNYSHEQLEAWAPRDPDMTAWKELLAPLNTQIAEIDGAIAGFISFTEAGHIELLYTSPKFTRQGVATQLFDGAKKRLEKNGVSALSTEASLAAYAFFKSQGFRVLNTHVAKRNGQNLQRYSMVRSLL